MRYQGCSQPTGLVDEMESSAYVEIDRANPALYVDCSDQPSLTRQEFADECDVNKIMARYEKTGILPAHLTRAEPAYLDVSEIPDLQTAMAMIADANMAFMALPASVRLTFDNDATKFVVFAQDPANLDKMREWKLAPPAPEEPAPQKVEIVNPTPMPPPAA